MANQTAVPSSSGIGAPGTAPAPANLSRSPMASTPAAAQGIPFTRGSTLATMRDATLNALAAASTTQVQLQTNAFLESLILDVTSVGAAGTGAVFNNDGPFNVIAQIKLDDPAGQSIVAPVTGFQLYTLNKYLTDTDVNFDPCRDPNYAATSGTGAFSFRLVVPVEHRRRDAFGALNNSAANQRYLLTVTTTSSYGAGTNNLVNVYSTAPSTALTGINVQVYQQYWTSPPSQITTSQGTTAVQQTPAGLGSVCFVRYERRNEVAGGGSPQFQLVSVGDYISSIVWTLRTSTSTNVRDSGANWPGGSGASGSDFDFWVNDFQVHALSYNDWQRWIARFYGYYGAAAAAPTAGALDQGVWPLFQMGAIFDVSDNFTPANQYLPTDATTKLQVRGSTWGSSAQYLDVLVRMIRPVSGAALFA